MKPRISMVLRVAVSVGLVGFLLWSMKGEFPRISETLANTNLILFSLAVLIFALDVAGVSTRLKLLFTGEGLRVPFGRVIQLTFIGYFFNNFMPTAVGGDIVKAYYAHKQTRETAKSFISVFMDRFIGLFSFVFLAIVALFLSWNTIDVPLKKIVFVFAFSGILVFLVMLNGAAAKIILGALSKFKLWNLGERLSKVYRAVHEYKNKKGLILAVIGISIIAQSIYFLVIYLLAGALGTSLALKTVFLIMPIVCIVSMLPSLGGLGLREGAMVVLFGPFIGSGKAFSLSVLLLAALLVLSLVGALIYVSAAQFRMRREEVSEIKGYSV